MYRAGDHFTFYTLHFALYTLHFTLYTLHFALCTLHFTQRQLWGAWSCYMYHFTLYTLHSDMRSVKSKMAFVLLLPWYFTLYTLHSELLLAISLYTLHFTLYTRPPVLSILLYTLHFTVYTLHFSPLTHFPGCSSKRVPVRGASWSGVWHIRVCGENTFRGASGEMG